MKTTKEMNNKKTAKNGLNPTSQKGITLIALIITIIIMLILVGVTISMAINGGLFDYAGKAVGDMKNAIAYEKELSNGRIKIGGVWYDSINDFVQGIVSGDQTEQDIIITGELREAADGKYIDLTFQALEVTAEEYMIKVYAKNQINDFIDYNIYVDEEFSDLEEIAIASMTEEQKSEGLTNGVINETGKNIIIQNASQIFNSMLGMEVVIPYEQSVKCIAMFTNGSDDDHENFLNYAMVDVIYCYICEIYGKEAAYEPANIESQILELINYKDTFDKFLESKGTTKQALQTESATDGISYGSILKEFFIDSDDGYELLKVDVEVSNGDSFESDLMYGYSYKVPEDGTYTFKATMKDGRTGETTISTVEDLDEWVMAWTCTDGVWSDTIEKGGTIDGDVVAKLYRTGETVNPEEGGLGDLLAGVTYENGPAYKLVIELLKEGKGELAVCSGDIVWHQYSALSKYLGTDVDFYYPAYVTEVFISDGITNIPNYAFDEFRSLQSVRIPETVTSIGEDAFSWCYALTNLSIPENVTSIETWAFCACQNLEEITIPEGVTTIAGHLFDSCDNLSKVIFEGDVLTIDFDAFIGCKSLTEITIPETVQSIGTRAFSSCKGLTQITIPANVTTIGEMAFAACENLKSVTLPASITSIGKNAFELHKDAIIYVPNETVKVLVEGVVGDSYTITEK